MLSVVERGRVAAVAAAVPYTAAVLEETGQTANPKGTLNQPRFTMLAPDGRRMADLLDGGLISTKQAVAAGLTTQEALNIGGMRMVRDVLTVMADTRRQVYHADIIQRPRLGGYVRMLNPPSCSRCLILAGKYYPWNSGFLRHPQCDCLHIPSGVKVAAQFTTDPADAFNAMSKAEQDATFTKSGARAIRDGADLNRVVNINQRGLGTVASNRRYGTPSRLTVDDIYRVAGTRTNAIRLLEQEGYILPTLNFPQ